MRVSLFRAFQTLLGKKIPIVNYSDAHSLQNIGRAFIVMKEPANLKDLVTMIRAENFTVISPFKGYGK